MRNGFILLHRKGIEADEWKHPLRTLAWIDLCTMAAWEDYTADDGVQLKRGEVIASYGYLARRWRVSKDTAHCWIKTWIAERQCERRAERCTERNAERFFLLNYTKYQDIPERVAERPTERQAERTPEPIERREENEDTLNEEKGIVAGTQTPGQQATEFFSSKLRQELMIAFLVERGAKVEMVRSELRKFISYWTEPNKTGTRVRWQMEKAFDVKRRLVTWFDRAGTGPRKTPASFNANI